MDETERRQSWHRGEAAASLFAATGKQRPPMVACSRFPQTRGETPRPSRPNKPTFEKLPCLHWRPMHVGRISQQRRGGLRGGRTPPWGRCQIPGPQHCRGPGNPRSGSRPRTEGTNHSASAIRPRTRPSSGFSHEQDRQPPRGTGNSRPRGPDGGEVQGQEEGRTGAAETPSDLQPLAGTLWPLGQRGAVCRRLDPRTRGRGQVSTQRPLRPSPQGVSLDP